MWKNIVAAVFMVICTAVAARGNELGLAEVTVRTYKFSISIKELTAARHLVDQILAEAGIAVSWMQCWSPDRSAQTPVTCNQPLRPGEVILKIGPAHDGSSPNYQASLGYSFIDVRTGTGSVAMVYTDRVRELSRRAAVNDVRLLAHAMAHEIGHLLLGANHASAGLMRAVWSQAELRRNVAADWRFSEDEAHAIAASLGSANAHRVAYSSGDRITSTQRFYRTLAPNQPVAIPPARPELVESR